MTDQFESAHSGLFLLCFRADLSSIFPAKGQVVSVLGFPDHPVSVAIIQLCRQGLEAAIDNM